MELKDFLYGIAMGVPFGAIITLIFLKNVIS